LKNIFQKIAAILAIFIGVMSVIAGSKVLLGIDTKEYNILTWLVSYNVAMGIVSIFTAILIWQNKVIFKTVASSILVIHFMVFIFLKFISTQAASESIKAMIFRTSIWLIIVFLSILIPAILVNKKNKF